MKENLEKRTRRTPESSAVFKTMTQPDSLSRRAPGRLMGQPRVCLGVLESALTPHLRFPAAAPKTYTFPQFCLPRPGNSPRRLGRKLYFALGPRPWRGPRFCQGDDFVVSRYYVYPPPPGAPAGGGIAVQPPPGWPLACQPRGAEQGPCK